MTITPKCADSVVAAYPLFQAEGGGSIPTSALSLQVEAITFDLAAKYNAAWHSALPEMDKGSGKRGFSVSYGAWYDERLFAVAIWSSPASNHLDDGQTIELRRLAICPEAPKNTASRLLRVMAALIHRKWPELRRVISYQATAVHAGTIYKAAGWTAAHLSVKPVWGTRKRRAPRSERQRMQAIDGYVTTPSTRRPPQIVSDKVRWEKLL